MTFCIYLFIPRYINKLITNTSLSQEKYIELLVF